VSEADAVTVGFAALSRIRSSTRPSPGALISIESIARLNAAPVGGSGGVVGGSGGVVADSQAANPRSAAATPRVNSRLMVAN
jgi:hypothetical protein